MQCKPGGLQAEGAGAHGSLGAEEAGAQGSKARPACGDATAHGVAAGDAGGAQHTLLPVPGCCGCPQEHLEGLGPGLCAGLPG